MTKQHRSADPESRKAAQERMYRYYADPEARKAAGERARRHWAAKRAAKAATRKEGPNKIRCSTGALLESADGAEQTHERAATGLCLSLTPQNSPRQVDPASESDQYVAQATIVTPISHIRGPFYIYLIRDTRPGKESAPIYVGKGQRKRAYVHLSARPGKQNRWLKNIIAKIRKASLEPTVEIIAYFETEAKAFQSEIELIAKYGRRDLGTGILCNLTDGGEGTSNVGPESREWTRSLENRERMRKTMHRQYADPKFREAHIEAARKAQRQTFKRLLRKGKERARRRTDKRRRFVNNYWDYGRYLQKAWIKPDDPISKR